MWALKGWYRVVAGHYTFYGCKNVNFQMKNFNIFLIFAPKLIVGLY